MKLEDYIGKKSSALLSALPFKGWHVERKINNDEELHENLETTIVYSFPESSLEVQCDKSNIIQTIFINKESYDGYAFLDFSFSSTRKQLLDRLGPKQKSGDKLEHEILGKFGPWDRFERGDYMIHVQYKWETDEVAMVTIMNKNIVP